MAWNRSCRACRATGICVAAAAAILLYLKRRRRQVQAVADKVQTESADIKVQAESADIIVDQEQSKCVKGSNSASEMSMRSNMEPEPEESCPATPLKTEISDEAPGPNQVHLSKTMQSGPKVLVKSNGRMGVAMIDHPQDVMRYKVLFDDGSCDWFTEADVEVSPMADVEVCPMVLVKQSGRKGMVVVDHPNDTMRYKVSFEDGGVPISDWFREEDVDKLTCS